MNVRRIVVSQGSEGARVFMRQISLGGGMPAASPLGRLLMIVRLLLLIALGVVVLVPVVVIGLVVLVTAVIVGGIGLLGARLRRGVMSLRKSDGEGRENVRVATSRSTVD